MGNASSQTLHEGGGGGGTMDRRAWANSYPRERERGPAGGGRGSGRGGSRGGGGGAGGEGAAPLRHPAHKVLPERVPGQRLRVTDNGAILHNGGTISGRRQPLQQAPSGFRPRSASQHAAQAPRGMPGGGGGGRGGGGGGSGGMAKRFGSEPDLRCPPRDRCDSPSKQRITSRSRKKYKAPAPPPEHDSSSPDSLAWGGGGGGGCDTLDPPARRLRLFKTRAETKRSQQQQLQRRGGGGDEDASPARDDSPLQRVHRDSARPRNRSAPAAGGDKENRERTDRDRVERSERMDKMERGRDHVDRVDRGERGVSVRVSPKLLQRSLSSPEFQAELMQVAQRIKTPTPDSHSPSPLPPAPPTLLPPPPLQFSDRDRDRDRDRHRERDVERDRGRDREVDRERTGRGEREAPLGQAARGRSPEPVAPVPAAPSSPAPLLPPRRKPNEPPLPPPPRQEKHWEVLPSLQRSSGGQVPARTFYFGMEQGEREAVERFAASLRRRAAEPPRRNKHTLLAGGSLSSDEEGEDVVGDEDEDESGLGGGSSGGGGSGGGSGGGVGSGGGGGIALQLRPTLPKKTPEIPRFSPTAAWRLLSALDAQSGSGAAGTSGSQATDEPPVLLEERIQGLSRPVAPAAAAAAAASLLRPLAAPRSSHDKSGDSGISGDASPGGCVEDAAAAAAVAAVAVATGAAGGGGGAGGAGGVVAWTPQQDLEGEDESSSDGGVDALRAGRQQGPALPVRGLPVQPKYSARAHVFSLSLPRDDRLCLALYADADEHEDQIAVANAPKSRVLREMQPSFNSLKKLKRSVSGAFGGQAAQTAQGLGAPGADAPRGGSAGQALDENWLLSRSVPNLLLHQSHGGGYHAGYHSAGSASTPSAPSPGDPPSFSYLASGGHVMYLPQYELPRETEALAPRGRCYSAGAAVRDYRPGAGLLSKSCEDLAAAAEMRQIRRTPSPDLPSMPVSLGSGIGGVGGGVFGADPGRPPANNVSNGTAEGRGGKGQRSGKGKRFTFQSTVRQIERRRLAERLSKEAELKERQRLSELEAMRQVEEEFQRKRAREKANIRQQLRLFSLDAEKLYASLPADWGADGTPPDPRADPEGAPSSSQSSAHSGSGAPSQKAIAASGGVKVTVTAASDLKAPSTQVLSEFREPRREYREYRPTRYIDSGPESLPHLEPKRATVHPPAVFDMPKSTQVYVTPHHQRNGDAYHEHGRGGGSTPRSSSSDNYRREFAHGTRPHGRSATSSDSDVSQVNGRPTSRSASRQTSSGYQPSRQLRSRSASPDMERTSSSSNMEEGPEFTFKQNLIRTSSNNDQPTHTEAVETHQKTAVDASRFRLTSLQPFVRNSKGYRPIVFNPRTPASHNIAQTVS